MSNFGEIKSKLLTKLTESYNSGNKNELKDLIKKLKSNKNLVEMHNFYEEMESMYFPNKDAAKLYVETLEPHFIEKMKTLSSDLKDMGKSLKDVVSESNEVYEFLDVLSEDNNIHNISKKINARENFIKFLTTKKSVKKEEESTVQFENHNLLNTVLVGNFNTKFTDFLNDEQKETFTKIVSMTESELETETQKIKSEINQKIESILKESTDGLMNEKLNKVKEDLNESELTKYNYFKMTELKKGLIN
jgi:hypothetical protein